MPRPLLILLCTCAVFAALGQGAQAQDEPDLGWHNDAEFSLVGTSGNSASTSLGFADKLWKRWEKGMFELNAGGIRVRNTKVTEFAVGTPSSFRVDETSETEISAENYFLNASYYREIRKNLYWRAGAGWVRNEPAGVLNRYTAFGTVGNIWKDTEDLKFLTEYGLTITNEDNVVDNPEVDDTYGGIGLAVHYEQKVAKSTRIGDYLLINENINDTEDLRANNTFFVSVAMTDMLSLKVSWQVLFDNQPALKEIELFDTNGVLQAETVTIPVDEFDNILKATLVVSF